MSTVEQTELFRRDHSSFLPPGPCFVLESKHTQPRVKEGASVAGNRSNAPQACSHAGEEGKKPTTSKGKNIGKHAPTRAHSSGAIACGGGNQRQQQEADEVFAALTLDGTEARVEDIDAGIGSLYVCRVKGTWQLRVCGSQPSSRLTCQSHANRRLSTCGHGAASTPNFVVSSWSLCGPWWSLKVVTPGKTRNSLEKGCHQYQGTLG